MHLAGNATAPEDILDRLQRGDDQAFAQLFQAYYPQLCSFTNGFVRSPDVAEELVQDIFLRLWEQRAELQIHGPLRAYLFGAVRNHALNYLKHERIGQRIHEGTAATGTVLAAGRNAGAHADTPLYFGELTRAFADAVARLPEGQRTVLTLRWRHHFSYQDIATTLGITIKTVETQLGRAIKQIRQRLEAFR